MSLIDTKSLTNLQDFAQKLPQLLLSLDIKKNALSNLSGIPYNTLKRRFINTEDFTLGELEAIFKCINYVRSKPSIQPLNKKAVRYLQEGR